jgi:cytidylate kinase
VEHGLIIAIDGPAGAGKSTVARELARKLGYLYIDTGAMYRTLALVALRSGIAHSEAAVVELLPKVNLRFEGSDQGFRCFLDDQDVSLEIRRPEVSEVASIISCYPSVREKLVALQRELGSDGGAVLEGRDIGTVVFPKADVKIFLDAAPVVRARRRLLDLARQGSNATLEKTLVELLARDERDQNRQNSPLTRAEGAMDIDTTEMDFEQVVAYLLSVIQERIHRKEKFARG